MHPPASMNHHEGERRSVRMENTETNPMSESAKAFVDLAVRQAPKWLQDIWLDNLSILDKVSSLESELSRYSTELANTKDALDESKASLESTIIELNKFKQGYSKVRTESDSNRKSLEVALLEISTLKRELEASNRNLEALKKVAKAPRALAANDIAREIMNLLRQGSAHDGSEIWSSTSDKFAQILFGNLGTNSRVAEITIQGNNNAWQITKYNKPRQIRR